MRKAVLAVLLAFAVSLVVAGCECCKKNDAPAKKADEPAKKIEEPAKAPAPK